MALTRAELLKRALIGGVLLQFGKLPELAPNATVSTEVVRIASARTAIPTAARYTNYEWLEDQITPNYHQQLETDAAPLTTLLRDHRNMDDSVIQSRRAVTAQRVQWLEDELMPRGSQAETDGFGMFTLPPQNAHFFMPEDIIRDSHSGENYHVSRVDYDKGILYTREVGYTPHDMPVIDPLEESRAIAEQIGLEPDIAYLEGSAAYDPAFQAHIDSCTVKPAGKAIDWAHEHGFDDERWR